MNAPVHPIHLINSATQHTLKRIKTYRHGKNNTNTHTHSRDSPDKEKALAILGEAASVGIPGGLDLRAGVDSIPCSQSRPSVIPHTSTPSSLTSSGRSSPAPVSPQCTSPSASFETTPHHKPDRCSRSRPSVRCDCSEELVKLEKEKLDVLRGIEQGLQETNNLARETLEVKKAKLQILEKQYALTEAQFHRPTISVPIIMPGQDDQTSSQ
nr:uncharacterized protein LOC129445961 [Misgurnus anguillicaudatus]